MPKLLVGADVGGTKTAVAVAEDGRLLASVVGRGAALKPGRALLAASLVAEVVRQALAEAGRSVADVLVVGAAGAGRAADRDELYAALRAERLAERVVVTTDVEIALAAAFGDGPGIVVTAGTGSIAIGRTADGGLRRVGGYGWQMGDEGSGYAIGRAALQAVSRAHDGRGPDTRLSDRLFAPARVGDFDGLVRWAASASPSEVAALAPAVLEAATEDPVARRIAGDAAAELALLARSLLAHFGPSPAVPLALGGSLLAPGRPLRRLVEEALRDEPRLQPLAGEVRPVDGALRL
ncbi:MAG TPA: BadF/BadG/BcrA/BcrD ATPase family protein, partial [Gemmatimonadales bacterium]|nr:BadF/BadG/BcrA/BcrD ATPase family protein [Gemmatimonadales bacterium]